MATQGQGQARTKIRSKTPSCSASTSKSQQYSDSPITPANDARSPQSGYLTTVGSITQPPSRASSVATLTFFSGDVKLEGKLRDAMESIWRNKPDQLPREVNLYRLDPKAIASLSRPNKRAMLEALATNRACVCVNAFVEQGSKEKRLTPRGGKELSIATILALIMALKKKAKLLAELVGLALPDTVQELSEFLRPPFITLRRLPVLVHCAARSLTHDHHGRSPDPVKLAVEIANAVGVALDQSEDINKDRLKTVLVGTFENARCDKERGCQVGLMLAGIQKYINRGQESLERKLKKCEVIIDVVSGLLAGIPSGGFAFSAVGSLLKFQQQGKKNKKQIQRQELINAVRMDFNRAIRCPIFLDEKISIKDKNGDLKEIKVESGTFRKWYDEIIEWNKEELS